MADYDVEAQTLKHAFAGMTLASVVFFVGGYLLWPVVEKSISSGSPAVTWVGLASVVTLLGVLMFAVMFPIVRQQQVKMDYAHKGYDVNWSLLPNKFFGSYETTVQREDSLLFHGMVIGSAGAMMRDKRLRERANRQRDMDCEVCGDVVGKLNRDVAYFVEHRKAFYLFGIPFRQKIVDVDAYCDNHKPKDWE